MGFRDPDNYSYTQGETADSIANLTKRIEDLEDGGGSGGTTDYNKLKNKPTINGQPVEGNLTIETGTKNYNELENKPKINSVELEGDKSQSDLHISGGGSEPSVIGENLIFS